MHDVSIAIWLLRLSIGLVMVLFGINQVLQPKNWLSYVPKWLRWLLPVKFELFMRCHGLGNLLLGAVFITGIWPVAMTWIVLLWWGSILPFALRYDLYIALRDLAIIAALASLLFLL